MLNKDEYNQDEYNDYYQQEIRGAETSGLKEEKPSKKNPIFILLGLIILAVGGYFTYTTMNSCSTTDLTSDESLVVQKEIEEPSQTIQTAEKEPAKTKESVEKEVENPVKTAQTLKEETDAPKNDAVVQVANNVEKSMGSEQKMSPEEIAKVVQMVMSQMNTKEKVSKSATKKEENTTSQTDSTSEIDKELMSELSGTDTDLVNNEDQKLEDALNNINETTKDTSIKSDDTAVDTYNKVKVSENTGYDELSKLSSQISSLISDKPSTNQTNNSKEEKIYTEAIKEEVVTRKNEMRIIVVRKGDSLGKIAKRAYGNVMEYRKIYKANPDILKRPDRIYVGQKLRIPK